MNATDTDKPTRKRAKPRLEQQDLPTMERPAKVKAIEKAARDYVAARDERMAAGEVEVQRKEKLDALMKENGLTDYDFDGYKISVTEKRNVKVKRGTDADDEEEADGE
jgi:predicted lipoprotein with Yx(FWY)xxD motif